MKTFLTVFFCAVFLFVSACSFQPPDPKPDPAPHVDVAMQYEGCVTGECDQRFLAAVNLQGNHNWCAAFVSYALNQTHPITPEARSGRVADFISQQSIDGRLVARGTYHVQKGDILIWAQNYSHAGFAAEDWQGPEGRTIEGNTSAPYDSNVRGVFRKQRSFHPGSHFRPRYITNVTYQ